jgi:hypothetical protein
MGTLATVRNLLIVAALIALAACTTTPSGLFCEISTPLRPSPAAIGAMTDAEVAAMLRHNKRGQALCNWKP